MKTKTRKLSLLTCIGLGLFTFSGCTDSDYDLSDIDMTVGIGNGELLLPTCSSDTIKLADVLKLNDSETVIEKENGDYFFTKDGDDVKPTTTSVAPVVVNKKGDELYDFEFSIAQYLTQSGKRTNARNIPVDLSEEKVIYFFSYEGDLPEEIEELQSSDIDGNISVKSTFSPSIKAYIPVVDEIKIELPAFVTIGGVNVKGPNYRCNIEGNKVTIYDVHTNSDLELDITLSKIDFTKKSDALGKIEMSKGKMSIEANLKMVFNANSIVADATGVDPAKCCITSDMGVNREIEIKKVHGRFNPSIALDEFGSAEITGIPDFLSEDGVVLDIENPLIMLNIESDLDIPGFAIGKITAVKDGKTTAVVDVPEMNVIANGTSKICICRNADKVDKSKFTCVVEVPNLSTILSPIPDHVSFSGDIRADKNVVADFTLGKQYTVKPDYRIEAPLAFAENAKIIYTDSFDDFNSDLEDIDVTENTYIEMTAEVENKIPTYLNTTAVAIDIDGNEMPESQVAVKVDGEVAASADGKTKTTSPLKVVLTPAKGAIKKLDGLKFTIAGAAKSDGNGPTITGQVLNARNHSLVISNIKIKIVGKAIVDMN